MTPSIQICRSSLALILVTCATGAVAGPLSDYLKVMQPLPVQIPAPQLADAGLGALCEEGEAAAQARSAISQAQLEASVAAEVEVRPAYSTNALFAPAEQPELDCARRFKTEFTGLRLDQQQLAREYASLRVKTTLGRQTCRPPSGGDNAEELQADCEKSIYANLAQPFAENAQKLWPSYWIFAQSRLERLRRELASCVELREQAQADAFKAGARRSGNPDMAAFIRDTTTPVSDYVALRKTVCRTVEAPVRASQWNKPAWVSYGPAQAPDGQVVPGVFALKALP